MAPMKIVFTCLILFTTACVGFAQPNEPLYVIDTVAGDYPIGDGGPATEAQLAFPSDVAVDQDGNVYVADQGNHRIRKVSPGGEISTVAGTGTAEFSFDGAPAIDTPLFGPAGVAVDVEGNLYIAERNAHRIRKVASSGEISTVAGTGESGFGGDGGPATEALLASPRAVAVGSDGSLYIADRGNHRIRKVSPTGEISTFAGTGNGGFRGDGGPARFALLRSPLGAAVDGLGNVYIADTGNNKIRKVDTSGRISSVAGTGDRGFSGDGGPAIEATLAAPRDVAVAADGSLYISDSGNHRIRKLNPAGDISTVAGTRSSGFRRDGGLATSAELDLPLGIAVDGSGDLFIADSRNHRIRRVLATGIIITLAGSNNFGGDGGPATDALLFFPLSVAVDSVGDLYIADSRNHRTRQVNVSGTITTVAGTGDPDFAGDGGQARGADLFAPRDLTFDADGNLYIADLGNRRVRKVTLGGVISTVAGNGTFGSSGDGGPATSAELVPVGVAVDGAGNLFIADNGGSGSRVRKVTTSGVITTVAGTGEIGFGGDGGPATAAQLGFRLGIAVDGADDLYIADTDNSRVRKVSADGVITTVVGTGGTTIGGNDGGPATSATIVIPAGLSFDETGALYVAERNSSRIRKISPSGIIHTVAGTGKAAFGGDGGFATAADFNDPRDVAIDGAGNVYIADTNNHRVRKMVPLVPASIPIVSGDNQVGALGETLPEALVVRVVNATGVGVPGVVVIFAVVEGSATLSATETVTDEDGRAGVAITLGDEAGRVVVRASVPGAPPVEFILFAGPHISAGGVVGGGLSVPRVTAVSPNAIISIFGANFAPEGTAKLISPDDLVDGRLPTRLGGVCVQIGPALARIFHVFPGQLNVQVPTIQTGDELPVQVILDCLAENEMKSNIENVRIQAATPEFFYFVQNPDGNNPVAAVNAVTGEFVGPGFTAAKPGDILTLFATGFGVTDPPFEAGILPDQIGSTVEKALVTVGEIQLSDADVLYAGVTPGSAGLYQLNLRIPDTVPDGDLSVVVQVGAFSTPPGGFLVIKR